MKSNVILSSTDIDPLSEIKKVETVHSEPNLPLPLFQSSEIIERPGSPIMITYKELIDSKNQKNEEKK